MNIMAKKEKTPQEILLEKIRKLLATHVVEVEIDMNPKALKVTNEVLEHARLIRNTALGQAYKRYEQMVRTKKYRKLLQQYGYVSEKISQTKDEKKLKVFTKEKDRLKKQLQTHQSFYRLTESDIQKECDVLQKRFNKALTVFSQTIKNGVWQSIKTLLFGNGKGIHFRAKGKYNSLEAKQHDRTIILKKDKNQQFYVGFYGMKLPLLLKEDDIFLQETFANIAYYMENQSLIEQENERLFNNGKQPKSTFRVKYNRIVRKEIRGKQRFFLQIVLEGTPVAKRKKDGSFRHTLGEGKVGADVGMQSVAISSEKVVDLFNLAERTNQKRINKMTELQQFLDRSRRKTNRDCFDKKRRAIKKMHTKSNQYKKKEQELRDLHRILAENRKYANNEKVNYLRSIGDELDVELMNFSALQKQAKEMTVNEKTGKINRKKRGGKSILNCAPAYFISRAKVLFKQTGGSVREVNTWTFKASQYDHTLDDTNKKQLSQRWHKFNDGTMVQRDVYSSFLLECSNEDGKKPDKLLCDKCFDRFKQLHDERIEQIKKEGKNIKNSGIKVSKVILSKKKTFKEKKKDAWFSTLNKSKRKTKVLVAV